MVPAPLLLVLLPVLLVVAVLAGLRWYAGSVLRALDRQQRHLRGR
jgi:type II secretory pathway component PulK